MFTKLVGIMEKLRSKNGCPWDLKQTHLSLKPSLIEETYEVIEAIDENDADKLKEELGDLLFQVIFHCQIAKDNKTFTIEDVLRTVYEKMVRRHPHVFEGKKVNGVQDVLNNWEKIKSEEKQLANSSTGSPTSKKKYHRKEKTSRIIHSKNWIKYGKRRKRMIVHLCCPPKISRQLSKRS